jgi:exodeoxyribonuclease V alpha subunit
MITLNSDQEHACELAVSGASFVLTGAAGTGKTTTTIELANRLTSLPNFPTTVASTRTFDAGVPGIFFLAFTRAAVRQLRKVVPERFRAHCMTIHKFVEMAPEDVYVETENGDYKTVRVYKPRRNKLSPFPSGIATLVFDEASMISETHKQWIDDALPYHVQEIYIGDINQLPTVADFSIFPQKLTELPVVELRHVYRQALESPIIRLAHKIKNGEAPTHTEITNNPEEYKSEGLSIYRFSKPIENESVALRQYTEIIYKLWLAGRYNPAIDIILCPWNKPNRFSTHELNRHIATFIDASLADKNELLPIHEVISMFQKAYYRVGDLVLYDKNRGVIRHINKNPLYFGTIPQPPSTTLSRWGLENGQTTDDLDLLDFVIPEIEEGKGTRQMSHVITLEMEDGTEEVLSTSGEFNALTLGYATSVHKSQGSQWPHVIVCLHKVHNVSINRELLYTAVTRAQHKLTIICEKDTLHERAKRQAIVGDTITEKIEWYRQKLAERAAEKLKREDDE